MVALPSAPTAPVIRFVVVDLPSDELDFGEAQPHPQLVKEACTEVRSAVNRWLYEQAAGEIEPTWAR